jgi:hypothetical protein
VKGRGVNGECVERARGAWKRQGRGKTAIADGRQRFKRAQAEPSGVRTSQTASQPASQARSIGSVKRGGGSAGMDDGLPCLVPSSLPSSSDLPRTRKLARSLSRASQTTHSSQLSPRPKHAAVQTSCTSPFPPLPASSSDIAGGIPSRKGRWRERE